MYQVDSSPRHSFQFASSTRVSTQFAPFKCEFEQPGFGVSLFNWQLLQYRQAGMHLTTCFQNETNNALQKNVWDSIPISYTTSVSSFFVEIKCGCVAFVYPLTQF